MIFYSVSVFDYVFGYVYYVKSSNIFHNLSSSNSYKSSFIYSSLDYDSSYDESEYYYSELIIFITYLK